MTERAKLVERGLRTRRGNSPAFRRHDLAKRLTARRRRFERDCEALIAVSGGNVETWAMAEAARLSARALHVTIRCERIVFGGAS